MERIGALLRDGVRKLLRAPVVDQGAVRELVRDFQRALLQADVSVELVFELSRKMERRILREELPPGISRKEYAVKVAYEELTKLMGGEGAELRYRPGERRVILFVGIQGCGKTTCVAKLAKFLKRRGISVAAICADTFRPAALEQLQQLLEGEGIPVYGKREGSSADIAMEGIENFRSQGFDVVLIDTAGRHKEEQSLMQEMREIAERVKPDETVLVVDATIGQQAFAQAKAFSEAVKVGWIFVAKLDSSAKGGGAISAVVASGAQIGFTGSGESLDDIEPYDPPRFVGRVLGFGDLKALLERVKRAEAVAKRPKELLRKFTMDDLLAQLESLQRMGPLRKLASLLPGLPEIPIGAVEVAEGKLRKWRYIIQSMTREERESPELIKGSRVRRIARGSGTSEKDVKELLKYYSSFRRMLKRIIKERRLRFKAGIAEI